MISETVSLKQALALIPVEEFYALVEDGRIREMRSSGFGGPVFHAGDVRAAAAQFPGYVRETEPPRARPVGAAPAPPAAGVRSSTLALEARIDASIERAQRAESDRRAAINALRAPGNGAIVDECLANPTCTVNMAKATLYDAAAEIRRNAGRDAAAQTRALAKTPASIAPTTDPARLAGRAAARAFAAVPGPSRLPRA